MLTHIVFWKFKEENKEANMLQLKAGLEALPAIIPEIKSLKFGIARQGGDWDASLLTSFDDEAGLQTYLNHPEHKKVSAFCKSIRTARTSVDYLD